MKDALAIAEEVRTEALRLFALGNKYIEIAMLCEGRHGSLPRDLLATHEELLARMTPTQRAALAESERRWRERGGRTP